MKYPEYNEIYQLDSKGKVRSWRIERDSSGRMYRTISGIYGMTKTTSEWTVCVGKNIGKANETTPEEQCAAEILAAYEKKLSRKYKTSLDAAIEEETYIKPQLATVFNPKKVDGVSFWMQPKLDGVRCIVTRDGMFSREGKPIVSCPHIMRECETIFKEFPFIRAFDGELYNHVLRNDFNKIVSIVKKTKGNLVELDASKDIIEYHIYDVIPDEEWKHTTFGLREAELALAMKIFYKSKHVFPVDTVKLDDFDEKAEALFTHWINAGFEGAMVRLDGEYEHKRSNNLMKWKTFIDEEFEVVDILEGSGNWSGLAKSVLCRMENGKLFKAGIKGDQAYARKLLINWQFGILPKYVTVTYQALTPDGVPRFGIAKAFYMEKRDL